MIIGSRGGVPVALARCENLQVSNAARGWQFNPTVDGQTLSGYVAIQVRPEQGAVAAQAMRLYARDADGQMRLLGVGTPTEAGWQVLWDTLSVLDGDYQLLAELDTESAMAPQEGGAMLAARVGVRNAGLQAALSPFEGNRPLQGMQTVRWTTRGAGAGAVVDLAYSPDEGRHWLALATGVPNEGSYTWDTTLVPDSVQAQVRLIVRDGARHAVVFGRNLRVNNQNAAPSVALLHPVAASSHGDDLRVVWETDDPDGDPLVISLAYRRFGGAWVDLATGLGDTGAYEWSLAALTPAPDYEVRITARDPSGAVGTDLVRFGRVAASVPPSVELLWPNGDASLSDDTVILWNADGEPGETLSVDLYYSDNAGQTWLPLAEGLSDTGYYPWQVSSLPAGNHYRVRVVARGAASATIDESDQVFSIGAAIWSDATLLAPQAQSTVSGLRLVRWSVSSAAHAQRSVSLQVRRVDATYWQTLGLDLAGVGVYLWNTRLLADGEYDLRLAISADGTRAATRYTQPTRVTVRNRANRPPEVQLLTPQGGEHWSGLREVTWRATDADGDRMTATLWQSWNGGQQWIQLARLDAAIGRYLWDTRQSARGTACTLRITVSDGQSVTVDVLAQPVYLHNVGGLPPTAVFVSPDAEGLLSAGRASWVVQDVDSDTLTVSLSISTGEGADWQSLAEDLPASGSYLLMSEVGSDPRVRPGEPFRLRLTASDGLSVVQVESAQVMVGEAGPGTLLLEAPVIGQTISGVYAVAWQLTVPNDYRETAVALEYSRDGERTWQTLARDLQGVSAFRWDTRDVANGVYVLRLTASLEERMAAEETLWQVRSAPFVVENVGSHAPVVSLLQPIGAETASGTRQVRWQATDADGDTLLISLAYSIDGGVSWRVFANRLANSGSYVWDTTITPNCARVWLRVTASDERQTSVAISPQPLTVQNPYAPVVTLLSPAEGSVLARAQRIAWRTVEEPTPWVRASVDYTLDGGRTWQNLDTGMPATGSLIWDTSRLPVGGEARVRVTVSDGLHAGVAITQMPLRVP